MVTPVVFKTMNLRVFKSQRLNTSVAFVGDRGSFTAFSTFPPPHPRAGDMGAVASHLAPKLPFYPPTPPSYTLCYDEDAKRLVVPELPSLPPNALEVLKLPTRRGEEIVAVYLRHPDATATILYSHGNAADLGRMFHFYEELTHHLCVNLMGYCHLILTIFSLFLATTQVFVIQLISFFWSFTVS